ncbi:hypothetical protein CVT26_006312 [Gymnopilus dilepis]|uniref:Nephrocystin 3-like N-terminal domain-containing protein n=1 Tax=Gymnopilus dilepis TaxID=231916 RepID=A0A409W629_9AGAR|nr:hypothetical protein CVT26_006312 [Gymnopilus dilepis]
MTALSSERRPAISFQVNTYNGDTYNGDISNSTVGGLGNDNKVESRSTSFAEGKLIENVAHQAFYNSGEAADPSTCHPETRVAVLAELQEWVDHPEQDSFIKWVKGSAGVGKTVIVRTMAEMLAERKQLLASFFFWRSGQQCNNAQYFVATVSYQICQLLPDCKSIIAQVVEEDPKIFTRTMRVQVEKLVTNPIASIWQKGKHDANGALVIVVDGLDECLQAVIQSQGINNQPQDEDRQCEILREVHRALDQLQQHGMPLRLLIASRPERHIQGVFDRDLKQNTSFIMLNDSHDATEDIRRYYIDKFSSIRDHHPLRHHLPLPEWPSSNQLDELVVRASGQFIYASTVMQFIGATRKNPSIQLDVILARKDHSGMRPLTRLDLLYQTIFSQIGQDDWPATQQLLGILLSDSKFATQRQPPTFWDLFLGWSSGEVEALLMALDSVLEIRPEQVASYQKFIHFYHASLQEFLLDQARSGPFFIDLNATQEEMAILCINHLSTCDDRISDYLSCRMVNWLEDVTLTPKLQTAFVKGGVDGVYPRNLRHAYPAFLVAIDERTRQGASFIPEILTKKVWTSSILDTSSNRKARCQIQFLLKPYQQSLRRWLQKILLWDGVHLFSSGHVTRMTNGMSGHVLYSFHSYGSKFAYVRPRLSREYFLMSAAIVLLHLLRKTALSHSLRDCIQQYPIPDPSQFDPEWQDCKADVAEYIARVEAEDARLQRRLTRSSKAQEGQEDSIAARLLQQGKPRRSRTAKGKS